MSETTSGLFTNYWEFVKKRNEFRTLKRPVLKWYPSSDLNSFQKEIYQFTQNCSSILDFGAGDLSLKNKFLSAGFQGQYQTCDVSQDFQYDYSSLEEVVQKGKKFDALFILEVIEHLSLAEFERFLPLALSLLNSKGKLVLSTPNAQAINAVWSGDLTHVKSYPLGDLWAIFSLKGFDCKPYRVVWSQGKQMGVRERLKFEAARVITHLLGVDYAVGIALFCEKKS